MISLGTCATLACIWEATAPKPGNVYRGADFEDLTYADFLTSATVIGPLVECAPKKGVGATILAAVEATRAAVGTNTNLGTLLLIVPLAVVPREVPSTDGIGGVLDSLGPQDTGEVYSAILLAQPGGMGRVEEADVNDAAPQIPLIAAMQLAAERDLVARQYTNNFEQVFLATSLIEDRFRRGAPLSDAILGAFLQILTQHPDSLIARKCGVEVAQEASSYAAAVLASGDDFEAAVSDLDFWFRSDGHRRNPGTTADLIAAGLFVLLRDGRLELPVRFY